MEQDFKEIMVYIQQSVGLLVYLPFKYTS